MPDILPMSPLTVLLTALSVFLAFFIATFIVIMLIRGLGQWNIGNGAARLTVPAVIVAKRPNGLNYYVTFQLDGGERMELAVDGRTYGLLAEGDAGQLTFQGTRYLGFVRNTGRESV